MRAKKIMICIGSLRKKETLAVAQTFEARLRELVEVDVEYVWLKDYNLQQCKGCFLCLSKGEELCSLKDDRDQLVQKLHEADGVVFAAPNYTLHVPAMMKNFFDRLCYIYHRPRFFGKVSTSLVTQGAYGGQYLLKYFDETAHFWGFTTVRGTAVTTVRPRPPAEQQAIDNAAAAAAQRFARALARPSNCTPPFKWFAMFRLVRSLYRAVPDETSRDYRYFRDNGWFTAAYYYPVKLNILHHALGGLLDAFGEKMARKRARALQTASETQAA
jgi:multimeric flavodoxin WrbA